MAVNNMKTLSLLQQLKDVPIHVEPPAPITIDLQVYMLEYEQKQYKIGVPVHNIEGFDKMLAHTDTSKVLEYLSDFDAMVLDT